MEESHVYKDAATVTQLPQLFDILTGKVSQCRHCISMDTSCSTSCISSQLSMVDATASKVTDVEDN